MWNNIITPWDSIQTVNAWQTNIIEIRPTNVNYIEQNEYDFNFTGAIIAVLVYDILLFSIMFFKK